MGAVQFFCPRLAKHPNLERKFQITLQGNIHYVNVSWFLDILILMSPVGSL